MDISPYSTPEHLFGVNYKNEYGLGEEWGKTCHLSWHKNKWDEKLIQMFLIQDVSMYNKDRNLTELCKHALT